MNTLKNEIEKTAKETGKSEIEVIQVMQAHLAILKDEDSISILHKIKMTYINTVKPKTILNPAFQNRINSL